MAKTSPPTPTLTAEQQDLAFNVSKAVREAVGPECDIMIETHAMLNHRVAAEDGGTAGKARYHLV
ncbi:MAG: hypothetical protein ACLR6J_09745 [Parabacteroides merdae]